jgi:hypothetical protein
VILDYISIIIRTMEKINVLVLPSDTSGVGKFRSVDPHVKLQNLYPNDFHVDIDYTPNIQDDNYWKKYNIVHFHRSIGQDYDSCPMLIEKLKGMGIIVIGDIDDYWLPTKEHPIHQLIMQNKLHEKIIKNLKACSYVITTTEIFANEIRKFNKNVVVLPNAIDPNEAQFKEPTLPSDKIRIGWLGGSSHLHDLKLMDGTVSKLSSLQDKLQFYVCGFDTRGHVTEINQQNMSSILNPLTEKIKEFGGALRMHHPPRVVGGDERADQEEDAEEDEADAEEDEEDGEEEEES